MKKILSVTMVALLAAGTLFAGFSGNATVSFGYDTTSKAWGFSNGSGVTVDVDLATANGEAIAEGDIYAGIKGSLAVKVANWKGAEDAKAIVWNDGTGDKLALGVFAAIDEAYVASANWKVAITGTQGAPDYAKSAIDGEDKKEVKDAFGNKYDNKWVAESYKVASNKVAGVTVTVNDWKGSFGIKGDATTKYFDYNAFVETPAFAFDAFSVKAAAIVSSNTMGEKDNFHNAIGASVDAGYTADTFTVKVAADFGLEKANKDANYVFNMDAALNVAVSPITADVYFRLNSKLLSAKVATDLTSFDVPVTLTVTGADLIKNQNLSLEATTTIDKVALTVKGGYAIADQKVSAGLSAKYTAELFTAQAGADWSIKLGSNAMVLKPTASVESTALVPGATLKLAYGKSNDDFNVLNKNYGKVEASCKIAF